jgi:hypothetical protein
MNTKINLRSCQRSLAFSFFTTNPERHAYMAQHCPMNSHTTQTHNSNFIARQPHFQSKSLSNDSHTTHSKLHSPTAALPKAANHCPTTRTHNTQTSSSDCHISTSRLLSEGSEWSEPPLEPVSDSSSDPSEDETLPSAGTVSTR